MRKTVLIPVVPMASTGSGLMLELMVEPGALGSAQANLQHLELHGLRNAVSDARRALAALDQHKHTPEATRSFVGITGMRGRVFWVRNPITELSNSAGAALGIALGLWMYDEQCPLEQIIAIGQFDRRRPGNRKILHAGGRLESQLNTAACLGWQTNTVPFVVPARLESGAYVDDACASAIAKLREFNIEVLPTESLDEAVYACRSLGASRTR